MANEPESEDSEAIKGLRAWLKEEQKRRFLENLTADDVKWFQDAAQSFNALAIDFAQTVLPVVRKFMRDLARDKAAFKAYCDYHEIRPEQQQKWLRNLVQ